MNWDLLAGNWKHLKQRSRQRCARRTAGDLEATTVREAREKRLAEWTAERHQIDPIHK